jgi:hypothetical protein
MNDGSWFILGDDGDGHITTAKVVEVVVPVKGRVRLTIEQVLALFKVQEYIEGHEKNLSFHYSADMEIRVRSVVERYHDLAVTQLREAKAFRDDMITWLRAIAIVAQQTASAGTHHEKDVAFRGLIATVNGAISKLRQEEFGIKPGQRSWFPYHDVFEADYPTRKLLDRIHELERQVKELSEPKGDVVPAIGKGDGDEDDSF